MGYGSWRAKNRNEIKHELINAKCRKGQTCRDDDDEDEL
jgi:hypothetical protein